jgi:type IV secretion system protein VirD4
MTGTKTVQKASYNFSGSRFSPVMGHVNASVDHIERPLMTPDEIMRIKPPRKARDGVSEKIVEPGLMLIFVAGHFPILGTQMLYFADPVLAKRAEVAPPTKFFAVEKGEVVPQRAADRTAHTISKPELAAPDESDLSPTERGYLEETRRHREA